MSILVWDQIGDHFYETGVSKGVLYKEDGYGVAWNGLTAVDDDSSNEVEELYFDGVKFNDIVTIGSFKGVVRAFTYPDEFLEYEGTVEDQTGFFISNQYPKKFCMSYQTLIGNEIAGDRLGYKIHLLYNLTAIPSTISYESLGSDASPIEFEWSVTSISEPIVGHLPTGHVIIDSLKVDPYLLQDIEDIIYGSSENQPYLPSLQSLATFIRKWDRLIVIDNGDGTWTATSNVDGIIVMLDETSFEITSDTAQFIDADSYTITSSEKNEEDIWL